MNNDAYYNRYGHTYYRRRYGSSNFSNAVGNLVFHLAARAAGKNAQKAAIKKNDKVQQTPIDHHDKIEPRVGHSFPRKSSDVYRSHPATGAKAPEVTLGNVVKKKTPTMATPSPTASPKTTPSSSNDNNADKKPMNDNSIKKKETVAVPAFKASNSNVKTANDNSKSKRIKEEIKMKKNIIEAKEVSEVGTKGTNTFGPKKLKAIVSPGQDEWSGNTAREKAIIAKMKDNTVVWPSVAGNGDDVFSGSKQKRVNMPVKPGEDVKNYKDWFNASLQASGKTVLSSTVKESYGYEVPETHSSYGKGRPLMHHDIEKHWATVHEAPKGTRLSSLGDTTILHHPDGSTHHIQGGEIHQNKMVYKSKTGPAEKGKFNVIHHSEKLGNAFVSNKKSLGFGFDKRTHDEHDAKDFKSETHAKNHITFHGDYLERTTGEHLTMHPKRSGAKIKSDMSNRKSAQAEHRSAHLAAVATGKNPDYDIKTRVAAQKIKKYTHPGIGSSY
jgi:hypothetical protein